MLAGCYGTLGLESGGVADTQLSASSVWEYNNILGQLSVWAASGARLKKAGLPWAPSQSDQHQWLQIDLKREKRITGTLQLHNDKDPFTWRARWDRNTPSASTVPALCTSVSSSSSLVPWWTFTACRESVGSLTFLLLLQWCSFFYLG